MLCISARDIEKSHGERRLFTINQLALHTGQRVGLVGSNGCGKSTLLRILAREERADAGSVTHHGEVALCAQEGEAGPVDAYDISRWGLRDGAIKSGGERTRGRVAEALSRRPHALLLDEPTASMDAAGVRQLMDELMGFEGALVIVSHDRDFLDAMTAETWELSPGGVKSYDGGFSAYREAKALERDGQWQAYEQYVSKRDQLTRAARGARDKAAGMTKAPKRMGNSEARLRKDKGAAKQGKLHQTMQSLQSRVDRLERVDKPREDQPLRFGSTDLPAVVSKRAAVVDGLTLGYGGRTLLRGAGFVLRTGEKAALVGPNGCGKTTLLRRMAEAGQDDPCVSFAPGISVGYFAQGFETLDHRQSMLDNIMAASPLPEHAIRSMLGRVGLRRDDVHKRVGILSGGERVKVQLARLLCGSFNLLLLDEPGNFLDALAMDALQELLTAYTGTLLLVTHDRALMELCGRRLRVQDGTLVSIE